MNVPLPTDEIKNVVHEKPGSILAREREKLKMDQATVASALNLRVQLVKLLEEDNYPLMPKSVFIRGYIRAYSKLLGIDPDPLVDTFNQLYDIDNSAEKALWQGKREPRRRKLSARSLSIVLLASSLVAAGLWWQKNKELQLTADKGSSTNFAEKHENPEVRLTDLSKMESLFTSVEKNGTESEKRG